MQIIDKKRNWPDKNKFKSKRSNILFILNILFFSFFLILSDPFAIRNIVRGAEQAVSVKKEGVKPITSGVREALLLKDWKLLSQKKNITDFAQLTELTSDDWANVEVPSFVHLSKQESILWYRNSVVLPQVTGSERLFLCFEGVKFGVTVWIDGKLIGAHRGSGGPFELDITAAAQNRNRQEIIVRIEGVVSVAKSKPNELKPGQREKEAFKNSILWPVGSQGFSSVGIWEPVRLEIRDTVQLDDLFIQTSVKNKKICIDGIVKNLTNQPRTILVQTNIRSASDALMPTVSKKKSNNSSSDKSNSNNSNSTLPKLEYRTITIPANATGSFRMETDWPAPRLWTIRDPHLYYLDISIKEKSTGRKILAKSERFGFREFETKGDMLYLNGIPMHALGSAAHPRNAIVNEDSRKPALELYRQLRGANVNFMRLHANYWPKDFVDVADEVGMPLILEMPFFCWVEAYALNDPVFWRNFDAAVRVFQKKHRNNPSFCMFSLCNEILHCGGERIEPKTESYLAEAGLKAKTFDPTRPILYDGDLDPKPEKDRPGVADVVNPHYPIDFAGRMKASPDVDWPNAAWWIDSGKILACYPNSFFKWDRKKPLYFGEFLHIQHFVDTNNYSLVLGDAAGDRKFNRAMGRAKARTWGMQIPAYRAAGVSGLCPWVLTEPGPAPVIDGIENPRYQVVKDCYEPVNFVLRPTEQYRRADSSKPFEIWLLNDTDAERELQMTIRMRQNDKIVSEEKLASNRLRPGDRKKIETVPNLSKLAFGEFTVELQLDNRSVDTTVDWTRTGGIPDLEQDRFFQKTGRIVRSFTLVKSDPVKSNGLNDRSTNSCINRIKSVKIKTIGLVGSRSAAISKLIERLSENPVVREIKSIAQSDDLNDLDTLLIGRNSLGALLKSDKIDKVGSQNGPKNVLDSFLQRGGTVIVLEQEEYPFGFVPVELYDGTLSHPLNNEWTTRWSCSRPFAAGATYYTFEPLCRIGGPRGFEYSAVLRSGNLFLSQLPMETALSNPAVLEDFVEAFDTPKPQTKTNVFVRDESGQIQRALRNVGASFTDWTKEFDSNRTSLPGLVFVNADNTKTFRPIKGQAAVLCGLTPQNLRTWKALLPDGLTLTDCSVDWSSKIVRPEQKTGSFRFYNGPVTNLHWLGDRTELASRVLTPVQKSADWAIVPFIAEESRANEFPLIGFEKFKSLKDRPRTQNGALFCGFNTTLSLDLDVPPGNYFLELNARATELWNVFSKIEVLADGQEQGTVEFEKKFTNKRVPFTVKRRPCRLDLVYFNDEWDPETKKDRNLWFRSARLIPTVQANWLRMSNPSVYAALPGNFYIDNVKWFKPDYPVHRASFYLADLLRTNGAGPIVSFRGLRIYGSQFEYDAKRSYKPVRNEPNALSFGTNGVITRKIKVERAGEYQLTLRASGTEVAGIYPSFDLLIDGRKAGEFVLKSRKRASYVLKTKLELGERTIGLRFTNDLYIPSTTPGVPHQDRNSQIEWLQID